MVFVSVLYVSVSVSLPVEFFVFSCGWRRSGFVKCKRGTRTCSEAARSYSRCVYGHFLLAADTSTPPHVAVSRSGRVVVRRRTVLH